jgi:hypothetical protein
MGILSPTSAVRELTAAAKSSGTGVSFASSRPGACAPSTNITRRVRMVCLPANGTCALHIRYAARMP